MKALLLVGAWTCWGLLGAGCGSTLATRGDVDLLFDGFEDAHGVPELNGTAEAMRVELAERMAWAPGASFVLPYEAGWVVEAPSAATDAVVHGKVVRGPRGLVLELTLKTPRGATIWRGRFDEHEVALAAHELARALGLTVAPQGLTLPEPTQRPLLGSAAFELEELVYSGKHGEVPLGELPNDDWGEVVRAGAEAVAGRTDRAVAILKSVIERTPNLLGARAQLARLDAGARPDEAAAIEQLQLDGLVFALQANPRMATLTELYARAVRAAMDRRALEPRDHIAKLLRQGSLPEAQQAALAEVPALWQRIEGLALTPEQRAGGLVEVAAAELLGHDPAAAEASLVALRRVLDAAPGPLQVEGLLSPPTLYAAQLARRARVELFRQAADATPQALREADPEIDAATAPLDARDCSGATLLHVAAERGDVAVLDALLARGADPLAANLFGETPLHRAARAGQVDSLRRLAAADRATRLEAFDDLGRTPLATAVAAGQLEVTRALIALGASLRARDVDGRTPLHIAARLDAGALVAALVAAHAPLESGDIDGATPLVLALEVGAAGAFDALVQAGAEVGPALIEPRTLSLALASRHPDIVARLAAVLQARAPNLAAQALAAAFRDDVPPIVAALLAVGAKPPLEPGETPLHVAARYGAEEVVADLVKRGAALEALDARGQTPLRTAIVAESLAAVEALTKGGASLAPGVDGLSALDFALLRSPPDDDIVTALAGPADLAAWAYLGDAQAVERALAADPQAVSRLGRDGLTPLHHAVRGNQPAIAQLLIQRGASPTMAAARHIAYAPEIEGWTPMHFAFAQLEEPMIQILRAAGAPLDSKDARGREAWRMAGIEGGGEAAEELLKRYRVKLSFDEAWAHDAPPPTAVPLGLPGKSLDDARGQDALGQIGHGQGGGGDLAEREPSRLLEGGSWSEGRGLQLAVRFSETEILLRGDVDEVDDEGQPAQGLEHALLRCHATSAWPEARRIAVDLVAARRDPSAPPLLLPLALQNLALVDGRLGDLDAARRGFGEALAGLVGPKLEGVRAAVLENRSEIERRLAEWAAAVADLRQALELRGVEGAPARLRPVPLLLLGVIYGEWGKYKEAIDATRDGIALAAAAWGDASPLLGLARGNLAVLYDALGDAVEARRLTFEQLDRLRAVGDAVDPLQLAIAETNAARFLLRERDLAGAAALVDHAVAAMQKRAPDHFQLGQMMLVQGDVIYAGDHPLDAEPIYVAARARLVKAFGQVTGVVAEATRRIAQVRLAHDAAGAKALLLEAWSTAAQADAPEERWPIEVMLGLIEHGEGRLGPAIFFAKQAVDTLEQIRFGARGVGAGLEKSLVESRIDNWRRLGDWLIEAGRLEEATRVLGLLKDDEIESLTTRGRHAGIPRPVKAEVPVTANEARARVTVSDRKKALEELDAEVATLTHEERSHGLEAPVRKKLDTLRDRLREARKAFERVLEDVEGELGQMSAARVADISAMNLRDASALQGTLGELGHGAVLVHYLVLPDKLRILVTTSTLQVGRSVAITSKDLNTLAFKLREALTDPHSDPTGLAHELYDLMITPIEQDLKDAKAETLMVSLDGVLRYVPMAALWDGERWLVERFRLALFSRAGLDKLALKPLVGMKVAALGLAKKVGGFSALPEVPAELEGIVRRDAKDADGVVPGSVWLNDDFSRDRLSEVLAGKEFGAIHIASHFVFEPGTEADSFLLLGNGDHLTLEDIRYDLRFDGIDVLSLSACDTALGDGASDDSHQGRELEGFAALTQRLGARSVLASLWPVADKSTAELMRALYGIRQDDPARTKAEALREAQLRFIKGPPGERTHPYYWAPFVLMGNWL